jgi:chorismate-pyruvate lyase
MGFSPELPPSTSRRRAVLHLATITAPFFPALAELGEFEPVAAEEMPREYQTLLAHDEHMTVTVEAFHKSEVDVQVLKEHRDGDVYTRCSLLVRQSDGAVVQFGIMWINMKGLSDEVRAEIEARRTPLGRVLIRHNVLRRVELQRLWRIHPGPYLAERLEVQSPESEFRRKPPTVIYGRSAGIIVEGRQAVELLEIVKV